MKPYLKRMIPALAIFWISGWIGWTLATIHACEKHDACEDAPAVIRDGLSELQAADPDTWCPPSGACRHAPEGWQRQNGLTIQRKDSPE